MRSGSSRYTQFVLVSFFTLVLLSACSSSSTSSSSGGASGGCGSTTAGCISGTVYADSSGSNGSALSLVSVTVDGTEITKANEQGWFFANNVRAGASVPVCFVKDTYVKRCRTVSLEAGQSLLLSDTRMMTQATAVAGVSGVYTNPSNNLAQITMAANQACVSGAQASNVTCSLTPIDANSPTEMSLAPGNFSARATDGGTVTLESGGMMDIVCKDGSGNRVDVCSGEQVVARIPINSDCSNTTKFPATMDNWSFNETTGQWHQEPSEVFTKTCNGSSGYYQGNVSHFSYWNADRWYDSTCLKGSVLNTGGAVAGALIHCDGVDYNGSTETYSKSDGSFCIAVKPGGQYSCYAAKGSFSTKDTPTTGTAQATPASCSTNGGAGCATIADFVLTDPTLRTVLTWGASPSDLDSHTVGPSSVHVYFSSKGTLSSSPYIMLDTDDTSSYGPEITTFVAGATAGKYRFCVHNWSGESSGPIAASGAVVRVFAGSVARTYTVPTSNPNGYEVWRVYEATVAANGSVTITDLNDFVDDSSLGTEGACRSGM